LEKKGKQFWKKKRKKNKKKRGKVGEKKWKNAKKKIEEKSIVDYYCNPQWFRCGETVISPHHLDIVNKVFNIHHKPNIIILVFHFLEWK
jgi:hypothetical protein